ncbi:hypothetical protein D3C73_1339210 [compost metagenome]
MEHYPVTLGAARFGQSMSLGGQLSEAHAWFDKVGISGDMIVSNSIKALLLGGWLNASADPTA